MPQKTVCFDHLGINAHLDLRLHLDQRENEQLSLELIRYDKILRVRRYAHLVVAFALKFVYFSEGRQLVDLDDFAHCVSNYQVLAVRRDE